MALSKFELMIMHRIGPFFLLGGVAMAVLGIFKVVPQDAWPSVVGFGLVPTLIFLASLLSVFFVGDPACSGIVVLEVQGGAAVNSMAPSFGEESMSCNLVPGSHVVWFVVFLAVALSGLSWKVFQINRA